MDRRSLLTFAAALTLPFVSPVSSAKDAVRLVVPFPAGGGGDTLARSVTTALAAALKTSLWVDNRPGAGGTVDASLKSGWSRSLTPGQLPGSLTLRAFLPTPKPIPAR